MEIIANAVQLVENNQNVLFTDTVVGGCCNIHHRDDSGIVNLFGKTNNCIARYQVGFSGNIALPTGGTPGEISVAIALEGEPIQSTRMRVTPAAVENYFNVSAQTYIDVPRGCCYSVAIENTSGVSINVQNANLTAVRVG